MKITAIDENDEYKSNAFTLKCIKIAALIYLGSWFLNIIGIFIIDSKIMNMGMIGTVIFLAGSHIVGYLAGLEKPMTKYLLLLCLISMLTFFSIILSYHTTMFMLFPMIYSVQYHSKKVTTYIYILTCIGFFVSVFLGFHIGVCDANMLLLTTNTTAECIEELTEGSFSINTSYFLLFLFYVFPRCMILTALIPLQNHITTEIQQKTAREIEARRLMEMDALTGLYNRNKYLSMIKEYYPTCRTIAVIYCDLNNLKTVNDSKGHESGDLLIIGMANVLKKFNSKHCCTYRIGGDEFVTILENPMPHQAEQLIEKIKKEAEEKEVAKGISLSVAVGLAQGSCVSVEHIINEADVKMYEEKACMKK